MFIFLNGLSRELKKKKKGFLFCIVVWDKRVFWVLCVCVFFPFYLPLPPLSNQEIVTA